MKKTKKEYMITIIAGIILVFLGIFFQVSSLAEGIIPLIFMNAGTIMIVIAVLAHNKYGAGITQDERTRAISSRALSYSWLLTFIVVNILFWINYTKVLSLSTNHTLGILLFIMTLSAGITQSLFKKRGIINED